MSLTSSERESDVGGKKGFKRAKDKAIKYGVLFDGEAVELKRNTK